ncbi:MAG: hypothetical protein J6A23_12020, partial [Thermoguttaceae bacterium]|nr:hypothetical protein [Thermoguttaceae bacterium]
LWEAARLASLLKKFLSLGGVASEARRGGLVCGDFLKTAFPKTHTNSRRMRWRAVSPKEKAAKVTA